ncbi:MAG: choice-of-anchor Q domain-containing protein [Tepidisphaeraceae bacterium]
MLSSFASAKRSPASRRRLVRARSDAARNRVFFAASEMLESRTLLTITYNVVVGGTLDINPISSIFPSNVYTAMEVNLTTVPGTTYGTISKLQGVSEVPWGSGAPNTFGPFGGTSNRIFSGEGFRYHSTGSIAGVSDSIPVRFRDSTGFTTQTDTLVINVISPAGAPQITTQPVGLTSVAAGSSATLSVVATGNAPLSYQWFSGLSPNAQFPIAGATGATYTTPGLASSPNDYYYWVRVSNNVSSVASTTATVKVGVPPTANAGGPYNVAEGGTVQLSGSGTDPNNGLYIAYEWDLNGDGVFGGGVTDNGNENVQNPVYKGLDGPAAKTIKLRTSNDRGLTAISNATVNVTNVAPSNVTANAPASVAQGQSFTLSGSFSDPGTLDAHIVTIVWGDGSPNSVLNIPAGQLTYSTTRAYGASYGANSNYTIVVSVADDVTFTNVNRPITVTRNNQLVVTTSSDEDDGTSDPAFGTGTSLREAMRYAEAHAGADTITFAAALANQTLSFSTGWNGAGDDTLLRAIGDLTIDGGNAITLKPAAGSQRRTFVSTGGTFTLKNITLNDADIRGVSDGGALWTNGTVVINNVRFNNNKANNGGAIANLGTITVTNASFNGNVAADTGGAISSGGPLNITAGIFTGNASGNGGAINSGDGLTVTGSTFNANSSGFNGGALRLFGAATISTSTISNNTAANGGGGLISHGTTTLTNVTIANNAAYDAGGAQFYEGSATLRHVTIALNTATHSVGGIAVNTANVTAINSLIAGNTAPDQNNVWGAPFNVASAGNVLNLSAAAAGIATLASNGGATQTILLLPLSPAIDAGVTGSGITTDQRGTARRSSRRPTPAPSKSPAPTSTCRPSPPAAPSGISAPRCCPRATSASIAKSSASRPFGSTAAVPSASTSRSTARSSSRTPAAACTSAPAPMQASARVGRR